MLVSSTTRPLLGCVWNFRSSYSGLAYATTSMVIHETLPIVLMAFTNVGSLYTLYTHGRMRSSVQDAPVVKRVPAERRAAKVRRRRLEVYISLNIFISLGSRWTYFITSHNLIQSDVPNGFLVLPLQVILALIMLFIASWGTSIISVNYFNYNRGASAEFLLVVARFANIIFIAMSPVVLAIGHRRLRSFVKSALTH